MKKFLIHISLLSLALILAACGQQAEMPKLDNVEWNGSGSFVNLAPGNEIICSENIEISSDDTDFIYHLTYGKQNLNLTFGLRDTNGTEYSQEIVGGNDSGTIENIPAGNYNLFARNSGDYSEYPAFKDNPENYNITGAIVYSFDD